jgi:hypothetical protein
VTDAKLTSKDYHYIATRLALVLGTAHARGLRPPCEVYVTSAYDDLVMHFSMEKDGAITLSSSDQEIARCEGRWPVTATIIDQNGMSLEIRISPNDSVQ